MSGPFVDRLPSALEDRVQREDGGEGWSWAGNAVLYPDIAGRLSTFTDQEARLTCFRASNDWLQDDFCAADGAA